MLHLIHPALVHFSVALLLLGASVEAAGLFASRQPLVRFGGTLVVLGTISLVPTVVSGFLAANTLSPEAGALPLLAAHERNGLILLGCFAGLQFWKAWYRGQLPDEQRGLYAALLLLAALLVGYSAWLGGRLVYAHGVGVERAARGRSGALEDRLEGVTRDFRIFAQSPYRIGVPVLPERDVDA